MPRWLVLLLRWGGPALVVVFAIPLFVIGPMGPHMGTPGVNVVPETTDAPLLLYWIFVLIGAVAAFVGWLAAGSRSGAGR